MPELNNKYDLESFENVENQTSEEFENFLKYKFCTEIRRDNEIIFTLDTDNVAIVNEILKLNKIIIKDPNNPDLYVERAKCLEKLDPCGAYYEGHRGYYDICRWASEEYDRYSEGTYFEDNYEMFIDSANEDELANQTGLYELEPIVKVFEDECNRYTLANLIKALSITPSDSPSYKMTYDIIKDMPKISQEESDNLSCNEIYMNDTWIIKTINLYPSLVKDINILDLLIEFAERFSFRGPPEEIKYALAALELDNNCTRREELIELLENRLKWEDAIHYAGVFLGVDNNFKWRRKIIELKFIYKGAQSALNEIIRLKNKLLPSMRDDSFLNIIAIICYCRLDNIKDAVCYYKENGNNINLETEYPLDGYLYYFKELSDLCKSHKEENEACEYLKRHIDCLYAHVDKLSSGSGFIRDFDGGSFHNDINNTKRYFEKKSRYNDNDNADDAITEMFRSVISLLVEYNLNQDDFKKYSIIFSDSWAIKNNLTDKDLHNLFKLSFYNFVLFLEYAFKLDKNNYNSNETFEYLFKTCAVTPNNLNLFKDTAYIRNVPNWSKEYYDNLVKIKNVIFANRINDSYKIVEFVDELTQYKKIRLVGMHSGSIQDEDIPLIMKYCLLDYMDDTERMNNRLFNGYGQETKNFLRKLISLWEDDKVHLKDKWNAIEREKQQAQQAILHEEQRAQEAIFHEIAINKARLEERDRIIRNQCHNIKNILRSVTSPLNCIKQGDKSEYLIDEAIQHAQVIGRLVDGMSLSYSGTKEDFIFDANHGDNGLSIEDMLYKSLEVSVANIIEDFSYYAPIWKNYFKNKKEFEPANLEYKNLLMLKGGNKDKYYKAFFKFICKVMFQIDCKINLSREYLIGNTKSSDLKVLSMINELIFNSIKYVSFVNYPERMIEISASDNSEHIILTVKNSYINNCEYKTTGIGTSIIDNTLKIMSADPIYIEKDDVSYKITVRIPNFWKEIVHGKNIIY